MRDATPARALLVASSPLACSEPPDYDCVRRHGDVVPDAQIELRIARQRRGNLQVVPTCKALPSSRLTHSHWCLLSVACSFLLCDTTLNRRNVTRRRHFRHRHRPLDGSFVATCMAWQPAWRLGFAGCMAHRRERSQTMQPTGRRAYFRTVQSPSTHGVAGGTRARGAVTVSTCSACQPTVCVYNNEGYCSP